MINRRVWGTLMPLMVGMGPGWECWAKGEEPKPAIVDGVIRLVGGPEPEPDEKTKAFQVTLEKLAGA